MAPACEGSAACEWLGYGLRQRRVSTEEYRHRRYGAEFDLAEGEEALGGAGAPDAGSEQSEGLGSGAGDAGAAEGPRLVPAE